MATTIPDPKVGRVPERWIRDNFVDAAPMGAEWTAAALTTGTVVQGTPKKLAGVTAAKGDANGFTIGTDQTLTATFVGTRLCRVQCILDMDIASATDAIVLHVMKNGVSVFETADQSVTATTLKLFEIDVLLEISGGDVIEIYGENEDTTVALTSAAFAERADTVQAHGFCRITSA